jgi:hypothetical protein
MISGPYQDVQMSIFGGHGARCLTPATPMVVRPHQCFQLATGGGPITGFDGPAMVSVQAQILQNGQRSVARRPVTQVASLRLRSLRGPNAGRGNRLQGISKGCPLVVWAMGSEIGLTKIMVDGGRESKRVGHEGEGGLQQTLAFEHRFFRLGGRIEAGFLGEAWTGALRCFRRHGALVINNSLRNCSLLSQLARGTVQTDACVNDDYFNHTVDIVRIGSTWAIMLKIYVCRATHSSLA